MMEMRVIIVNNEEQVLRHVQTLQQADYALHQIYILSFDKEMSRELTEISGTGEILISSEGLTSTLTNLLRFQGERLIAEMEALGLTEQEARQYEHALEFGGYLIAAKPKQELPSYLPDQEWVSYDDRVPSFQSNQ
jgi:hypothetical protein